MPKRVRGDQLTGGSRDVNPQFMHGRATQSGNDATTTTTFRTPITRIPDSDRVTIMELLKVYVDFAQLNGTAVAETNYDLQIQFSTVSLGTNTVAWDDPNVFAKAQVTQRKAFTAGGSYAVVYNEPFELDLTDGAGHGILIATDSIYGQVSSANTGTTNTVYFKLLYRFKEVGLIEYVGIVQSQQ